MKQLTLLLFLFLSVSMFSQKSELSIFDNLVSKTWKAKGNWGNGSKFYQEVSFEYSLDSTIVVAKSVGYTNQEQTKIGLRNHGIRQFDKTTNTIKFWEFDVFGGLTEGIVFTQGKNIFYQYKYGESTVTDLWEYVNDFTYNYKVGNYENGEWKQVYLETQFTQTISEIHCFF